MLEERYKRNRIYVTPEEQEKIKNCKILLGGAGIGSNIAECALRFGFEQMTIVDGDIVEMSNLNRQNYSDKDLGKYKSESLTKRLLQINPNANIQYHTCFIDSLNVKQLVVGHQIAINALDFSSDIPFLFDQVCKEANIPVLHPYNIGWAGLVTVTKPDSKQLTIISETPVNFELKMVEYVTQYLSYHNKPQKWIEEAAQMYRNQQYIDSSSPQLSIASWIVAGLCTQIMFQIFTGKPVKTFPQFYLTSGLNSIY